MPHGIASYILRGPNEVVMIETGPGSTVTHLERGLAGLGLRPADVTHVLVTHIHLDHAGAAGWMAQQGAEVYVHHVGERHLIDPSRLWASASRIYGDQMAPLWGEMLPIPRAQLHALHDGDVLHLAGCEIVALDTPGHASHHMAYWIDGICFTGDLAAARIPGRRHVRVPTPPPDIDVPRWHHSVDRVRQLRPQRLYLTHYGPVEDALPHLAQVDANLDAMAVYIREGMQAGADRAHLIDSFAGWLAQQAVADDGTNADVGLYEVVTPTYMAVDGLTRYWQQAGA
jgi:glyoxylase-like metal-dependent hydrolase (beta-lactamase superfamily II)